MKPKDYFGIYKISNVGMLVMASGNNNEDWWSICWPYSLQCSRSCLAYVTVGIIVECCQVPELCKHLLIDHTHRISSDYMRLLRIVVAIQGRGSYCARQLCHSTETRSTVTYCTPQSIYLIILSRKCCVKMWNDRLHSHYQKQIPNRGIIDHSNLTTGEW